MSDVKVLFTGLEIIEALKPEIARRLQELHPTPVSVTPLKYEIVLTRWEMKEQPYKGSGTPPPGMVGMTVNVEFTLERRAEMESS